MPIIIEIVDLGLPADLPFWSVFSGVGQVSWLSTQKLTARLHASEVTRLAFSTFSKRSSSGASTHVMQYLILLMICED